MGKEVFISELLVPTELTKDNVGDQRCEGERTYRYVQNNASGAFAVGDTPVYDAALGNKYRNGIAQATTATLEIQAGVVVAAMPPTWFGWIQISGPIDLVNITSTAHVRGDVINCVNASNIGVKASKGSQVTGAEGTIIITNAATSATPEAVVRCLGV